MNWMQGKSATQFHHTRKNKKRQTYHLPKLAQLRKFQRAHTLQQGQARRLERHRRAHLASFEANHSTVPIDDDDDDETRPSDLSLITTVSRNETERREYEETRRVPLQNDPRVLPVYIPTTISTSSLTRTLVFAHEDRTEPCWTAASQRPGPASR